MKVEPTLPIIVIEPVETPPVAVRLSCCPITLNPLIPDRVLTMDQFESGTGRHCFTLTGRSHGPIMLDNVEVVEVHRGRTTGSGTSLRETMWLGICGDLIRVKLRDRYLDDHQDTRRVDVIDMSFPASIAPGFDGIRIVRYIHGAICAEERFRDSISESCNLTIGDGSYRCLKLVSQADVPASQTVETYIDEQSGNPVLARIFAGESPLFTQIITVQPVHDI